MAPKLQRPKSTTIALEAMTEVLYQHLNRAPNLSVGAYETLKMQQSPVFKDMLSWLPALSLIFEQAPSAVVSWESLKRGAIEVMTQRPTADP
eukprot:13349919-Alexandrium_andersonii.AAC.1